MTLTCNRKCTVRTAEGMSPARALRSNPASSGTARCNLAGARGTTRAAVGGRRSGHRGEGSACRGAAVWGAPCAQHRCKRGARMAELRLAAPVKMSTAPLTAYLFQNLHGAASVVTRWCAAKTSQDSARKTPLLAICTFCDLARPPVSVDIVLELVGISTCMIVQADLLRTAPSRLRCWSRSLCSSALWTGSMRTC